MSKPRQHVKVYLHDDWLQSIRTQAALQNLPVSEFIRQCIAVQLPENRLSKHKRGRQAAGEKK
jgi:hypothetical protein